MIFRASHHPFASTAHRSHPAPAATAPGAATAPAASASAALPTVVLLDLDGTLVGSVASVLCELTLLRAVAPKRVPERQWRESVVARLRYGIIRPHVLKFCKEVSKDVELFVYTASEHSWATVLIPCVEAALGVRFNRPIFTRNQCDTRLKKSIRGLLPSISRALHKRWPAATLASLRDRVVLVDNTPSVMASADETSRVILCPTYGYDYTYDVLRLVPVDVLHNSFARLVPILTRFGFYPSKAAACGSYQQFAAVYYQHLSRRMDDTLASNRSELASDRFFVALLAAMHHQQRRSPSSPFSDAVVREINAGTRQRLRSHRMTTAGDEKKILI
jgi:hypothetical protein